MFRKAWSRRHLAIEHLLLYRKMPLLPLCTLPIMSRQAEMSQEFCKKSGVSLQNARLISACLPMIGTAWRGGGASCDRAGCAILQDNTLPLQEGLCSTAKRLACLSQPWGCWRESWGGGHLPVQHPLLYHKMAPLLTFPIIGRQVKTSQMFWNGTQAALQTSENCSTMLRKGLAG